MLNDDAKVAIQKAYTRFLREKQLGPRQGQKLMIAAIARTLGAIELDDEDNRSGGGHVCVVEAGTGTGKTVAYLLATIPSAHALGKKVVISTATVALQEQIVVKDLPEVQKHSGLEFTFGLAKGRGRYLCLSRLDAIVSQDDPPQAMLLASDNPAVTPNLNLYQDMMDALAHDRWDGDRDNWTSELPAEDWQPVTTDHRQCTGRKCSFVRQCAFFRARDRLEDLDVIVANHDLVLADLALGGGAILPAPAASIYIFDEGHHLPEKARSHFSVHTRLVATARWLGQIETQWKKVIEPMAGLPAFSENARNMEDLFRQARQTIEQLQPSVAGFIPSMDSQGGTSRYRFARGVVPDALEAAARSLEVQFGQTRHRLEELVKRVDALLADVHSPVDRTELEVIYAQLGGWLSRVEANEALWNSYADTRADPAWPMARWVTLVEQGETVDFELVACPVLSARTLSDLLWERCCGAIVTSATLTALGSFDRFRSSAGTPADAHYEVVPSPFDFSLNGCLRVPRLAVEGNQVSAHTDSIITLLPQIVVDRSAVLVLFASRRQMHDVYMGLDHPWRERVLMQGEETKQRLLQKHREKVDANEGSVIFGLASFAEGVDLPGRYCEHVVIAKIPFSVPDDPVEAAMAEWIEANGGNAFMQIAVPDAAVRLVQACGRLLRTETDTGTVTLLDKRILTKSYGRAILDTLPAFRRELNHD